MRKHMAVGEIDGYLCQLPFYINVDAKHETKDAISSKLIASIGGRAPYFIVCDEDET